MYNNEDDGEGFDPRPLYEPDQVITCNDLEALAQGFVYQHYQVYKWYNWYERFKIKIALGLIQTLHNWIHAGKPADMREGVKK